MTKFGGEGRGGKRMSILPSTSGTVGTEQHGESGRTKEERERNDGEAGSPSDGRRESAVEELFEEGDLDDDDRSSSCVSPSTAERRESAMKSNRHSCKAYTSPFATPTTFLSKNAVVQAWQGTKVPACDRELVNRLGTNRRTSENSDEESDDVDAVDRSRRSSERRGNGSNDKECSHDLSQGN